MGCLPFFYFILSMIKTWQLFFGAHLKLPNYPLLIPKKIHYSLFPNNKSDSPQHVLGDELANEVEERPDFRTSFVVSEDVKDKIITHESSVGDLSAQINSEDSDNEQAENLNIFVVAPECKSSLYALLLLEYL